MAIDWDDIWNLLEETENVDVYLYNTSTDSYAATPIVVKALRLKVAKNELNAESGELYNPSRSWHLRGSDLGTSEPTVRSKIVQSDGTEWVVEEAELQTYGARWFVRAGEAL